ncbi:LysR family transcriptional regulator [Pseudomonas matsuisoli]|uniref:LysR family transcriptional regulator n=1 Tax=Pseudomonas matsuisoli TaxID=1515666 RepID=A0A917PY21_9PSED|nr:LysR family transcriptional regulator [Pseudomonas matsuisoli]GGJ98145.1 LysR family transcriptional regulator [Pseudomonas matsuisoli]
MNIDLNDLRAFLAVANAGGFRDGARRSGASASRLSDAVRRLETQLGVRLLHRSTRSVVLTEVGRHLLERVSPALAEVSDALDVVNGFRDSPVGTLKLNVPVVASRLVLPRILPGFVEAYPNIQVQITAEDSFVDVLTSGCDAGIRYGERLEQDMIAIPIGPRVQRYAAAASPAYLTRCGHPAHPNDLLEHACMRGRFSSGALATWEFERDGQRVEFDPNGPLEVRLGGGADLMVDMALAGSGIVFLFEDWLQPYFDDGRLMPVLEPWWVSFSGPFLYYPGRRLLPGPLRAFVDYVKDVGPDLFSPRQ